MDNVTEVMSIKQECLNDGTDIEDFDWKLVKEEALSIDNSNEKGEKINPITKEDINPLDRNETENINFHFVPLDSKFVKHEEEFENDWNANAVDPLLLTSDQLVNITTESSSDTNSHLPNGNNREFLTDNIDCIIQEHTSMIIFNTNFSDEANNMEAIETGSETQNSLFHDSCKSRINVKSRRNNVRKQYKCSQCNYCTARKSDVKIHSYKHTGEKPFKCSQCDYATAHKSNLKVHSYTHTGEKPFKCSQCDYSTAHKSDVKIHSYVHTGEKPFKCSQCDYATAHKSDLKVHSYIHSGEKPFKCSLCNYSTAHRTDLRAHSYTHTGEKPFKCSQCDYSTVRKSELKYHLFTHIGEKLIKFS